MVAKKNSKPATEELTAEQIVERTMAARREKVAKKLKEQEARMLKELKDPNSPAKRRLVIKAQIELRNEKIRALKDENKQLRAEMKAIREEARAARKGKKTA